MTRVAASLVLVIAAATGADAHRLDEYLQAARVAVTPRAVVVHLDLTPGISLAADVISLVDRDGDGRVSPIEAEGYARAVLAEVAVLLDGAPRRLTLTRVEVPPAGEMRGGEGTIRIEAGLSVADGFFGRHRLELRNLHLPDRSVYLANALMPDDEITILRQDRDVRQQTYRLDYEIRGADGASGWWLLAGATALLVHARWRTSRLARFFPPASPRGID